MTAPFRLVFRGCPQIGGTLVAIVLIAACGSGSGGAGEAPETPGAADKPAAERASAITVPTAEEPGDPCGWIPAADVEAVVGKLAEPPAKADGCRYVMTLPDDVAAKRQEHVKRIEAFQARFKTEVPTFHGPMANYQSNPRSYAVSVSVDVAGDLAGEIGLNAGMALMAREMGGGQEKPAPPEGWDSVSGLPYGFSGRLGHVRVSVQADAPDVPRDLMARLAAAVRDRIPDLPFKTDNPYQVIQLGAGGRNPCDLLTRAEVEAVLGPLVVDPYRSSSQHPPLALASGHGCAYYTRGHRVFAIVPEWSGGEQTFKISAGIGGLLEQLLPEERVIFKGPWDQAQIERGTGALLFLKGDSLLTVHYLASSADRRAAVKLAASAMRRLPAS